MIPRSCSETAKMWFSQDNLAATKAQQWKCYWFQGFFFLLPWASLISFFFFSPEPTGCFQAFSETDVWSPSLVFTAEPEPGVFLPFQQVRKVVGFPKEIMNYRVHETEDYTWVCEGVKKKKMWDLLGVWDRWCLEGSHLRILWKTSGYLYIINQGWLMRTCCSMTTVITHVSLSPNTSVSKPELITVTAAKAKKKKKAESRVC